MHTSEVQTNGIRMQFIEEGTGPLVVLCHGFPELGYSWRHQIGAIAAAGYRVVAPDQRGFGGTDRPSDPTAYTLCHLTADIVGLVQALGEPHAAIIGHDWGSAVAWTAALLRPDLFRAVGLLSVPYLARLWSGPPPTSVMRQMLAAGHMFYQLYLQDPGRAESDLEKDVRDTMLRLFASASGGVPPEKRWRFVFSPSENLLDTLPAPDRPPAWLTQDDLAFFTAAFEKTGFTGGLNWYRNMDRDRELLAFLAGSTIAQPSIFIGGAEDAVVSMYAEDYNALEQSMPGLTKKVLIPGAGHWVQQERPQEVSARLVEFLATAFPIPEWTATAG